MQSLPVYMLLPDASTSSMVPRGIIYVSALKSLIVEQFGILR